MSAPDPLYARFGREYPAGEVLFREGESGTVMYVIQAGRVRITRSSPLGERSLAMLGPGEFFGEMAILNGKARAATATVVEPLRALAIDARTFESMVLGNTGIALRLVKKLARRLDRALTFIEVLLQQDPRLRVVLGLARIADELGVAEEGGVFVESNAEELARSIGLDEEEVREVLARLVRVKVIAERPGGGWMVGDLARLREFSEFLETRDRRGED